MQTDALCFICLQTQLYNNHDNWRTYLEGLNWDFIKLQGLGTSLPLPRYAAGSVHVIQFKTYLVNSILSLLVGKSYIER